MENSYLKNYLHKFILIWFYVLCVCSTDSEHQDTNLDRNKIYEDIENICIKTFLKFKPEYETDESEIVKSYNGILDDLNDKNNIRLNEVLNVLESKKMFVMHALIHKSNFEFNISKNVCSFLHYLNEFIGNSNSEKHISKRSNAKVGPLKCYNSFKTHLGYESQVFIKELQSKDKIQNAFLKFSEATKQYTKAINYKDVVSLIIISDCFISEKEISIIESNIQNYLSSYNSYIYTIMKRKNLDDNEKMKEQDNHNPLKKSPNRLNATEKTEQYEASSSVNVVSKCCDDDVKLMEIKESESFIQSNQFFLLQKKSTPLERIVHLSTLLFSLTLRLKKIQSSLGSDMLVLLIDLYPNNFKFEYIFSLNKQLGNRIYYSKYDKSESFDMNTFLKNLTVLSNYKGKFKRIYSGDFDCTRIGSRDIFLINSHQIMTGRSKPDENFDSTYEFQAAFECLKKNCMNIFSKYSDLYEFKTFSIFEKQVSKEFTYSTNLPRELGRRTEFDGDTAHDKYHKRTNTIRKDLLEDTILSSEKEGLFKVGKKIEEIFADRSKEVNFVISVTSKNTFSYLEIFIALKMDNKENKVKMTIGFSHSPLLFEPFCVCNWFEELSKDLKLEFY